MMKKSNRVGLLVFVVVMVALFAALFATGVFKMEAVGGFTPLSLSRASVVNDGVLGESWLLSLSTLPSALSVVGRVSAGDVSALSGSVPVSDFELFVGVDQELQYPITGTGEFLYTYSSVVSSPYICIGSSPKNVCSGGLTNSQYAYGILKTTCVDVCTRRVAAGQVGVVQASPAVVSNITVRVVAAGKSSSDAVISTKFDTLGGSGSKSAPLFVGGKKLGSVSYAGDLVLSSQYRTELFQLYKPINRDGVWFFVSKSAFDNYDRSGALADSVTVENKINGCIVDVLKVSGINKDNLKSYVDNTCLGGFNSGYAGLREVKVSGFNGVVEERVDGKTQILATFSSGVAYVAPTLSLLIDADWVGLKVNKGVPKVVSAQSSLCTSGNRGKVDVVVKNTGSGLGVFDVVLQCPSGVSVLTGGFSKSFQGGESKAFSFEFDMNVAEKTMKTCSVKATDTGSVIGSAVVVSDSKSVDVSCNPARICVAGQKYCDGQVRKECNSDGTAFNVVSGDTSCMVPCDKTTPPSCNNNESICQPKFLGMVTGSLGVKESCNFWCNIGLKKPEPVNVCVYDWTPVYLLLAAAVVAVVLLLVFARGKGGKKGRRGVSQSFSPSKFWREHKWTTIGAVLASIIILSLIFPTTFGRTVFWIVVVVAFLVFGYLIYKKVKL